MPERAQARPTPAVTPTMRTLEWTGSICGIVGSWLIASYGSTNIWAWLSYLVANACIMAYSSHIRSWGLFAQQACFLGSTTLGLYKHAFS